VEAKEARGKKEKAARGAKEKAARGAKASARTVEIAVQRALAELGVAPGELSEGQYQVEVLVPPEEGFLGVEGVDAEVRVSLLLEEAELLEVTGGDHLDFIQTSGANSAEGESGEAAQPGPGSDRLREYLGVVLQHIGVDASLRVVEEADRLMAEIEGEDVGIVIGRGGRTLDAIEYLASISLYPNPGARKRVVVDAEGYKERRREKVERIAFDQAREAARKGEAVKLAPMTGAERKIVHLALRDRRDVVTESEGNDPRRVVVISPVSKAKRDGHGD